MTLRSCLFPRCYKYPSQHCFSCRPHTLMFCVLFIRFSSVFLKKTPRVTSPLTHGSFTRVWFSSQCLEMFLLSCCDWFCWSPLWSEYKHCDFSSFRRVDICCMAWGLISLGECSILWTQEHSVLPAGLSRGRLWAGGWCASPTSGLVFCLVVLWVVERTKWSPQPYLQIWLSLLSFIISSLVYFEALIGGLLSQILTSPLLRLRFVVVVVLRLIAIHVVYLLLLLSPTHLCHWICSDFLINSIYSVRFCCPLCQSLPPDLWVNILTYLM